MTADLLAAIKSGGDVPRHVAVIMDGNGRWAAARGLPRHRGHRAGIAAVRDTVEGAAVAGVRILTLFAFSQENWQRPAQEVAALMALLRRYARRERANLRKQGVEVRVFGDLSRLSAGVRAAVHHVEAATRGGSNLRVNIMISYGGRTELVLTVRRIAEQVASGDLAVEDIDESSVASHLYTAGMPDPDLLIRTSGEQRISNFMLWQIAYTELYTLAVLWPDFRRTHLFQAIRDYQRRERRFGRVGAG